MAELHYNILDDLSEDLALIDLYHFMSIDNLTYELKYNIHRRVEFYYQTLNPKDYHNIANYACIMMDFRSIIWLRKKGIKNTYRAMVDACCLGRLKMIKWLHYKSLEDYGLSEESIKREWAFDCACRWGHIEVVKWMYKHNYRMDGSQFDIYKLVRFSEGMGGIKDVIRFLCAKDPEWVIRKVRFYDDWNEHYKDHLTQVLRDEYGFIIPKIDE